MLWRLSLPCGMLARWWSCGNPGRNSCLCTTLGGVLGGCLGLNNLPVHLTLSSMSPQASSEPHGDSQGTSQSVLGGGIYYCLPPLRALGHKQCGAVVSPCAHLMPALPEPPEKSPAFALDAFEYFQDKEDDLDKPYNDRSYLSSEGLARDDARTGELPTQAGSSGVGTPPPCSPPSSASSPQSSWPC